MWENLRTVLRLTVYERRAEDHFTGSIYHVDLDEEIVDFVVDNDTPGRHADIFASPGLYGRAVHGRTAKG